jgi:hypothetical protein
MKMSVLFGRTLREAPSDAEVASQKLLVRAGFIRQPGAGVFSYMHLAQRSVQKTQDILRQERSYDYLAAHEPPHWELAFTHVILAHAAFAAGDRDLHRQQYAKALEIGPAIADPEDRGIFFGTFDTIPEP